MDGNGVAGMIITSDYGSILKQHHCLVGGFNPLEKMKVSWDDEIPNIWKNKTCSKPPTSYPWDDHMIMEINQYCYMSYYYYYYHSIFIIIYVYIYYSIIVIIVGKTMS